METQALSLLYGPLLSGLAVSMLAIQLMAVVFRTRPSDAQEWEFDKCRQIRRSDESALYRWFEPFLDELAKGLQHPSVAAILDSFKLQKTVQKSLDRLGDASPFRCYELLALATFQGIAVGVIAAVCLREYLSPALLVGSAFFLAAMTCYGQVRELNGKANRRMAEFKRRLPFSVDLMALMMDAGATFMESLATTVAENSDNPVGEEFGELQRKILSGCTLTDALEDMRVRLADPTIDEIVFSIVNSEKQGAPKSATLLRLANQMRQSRSQAVEKAIGQAQTMMTFPGFIIMLACLLIVAAPFGLAALQQNLF